MILVMYRIKNNILFIFKFLSSKNFPKQGTKREPEREPENDV